MVTHITDATVRVEVHAKDEPKELPSGQLSSPYRGSTGRCQRLLDPCGLDVLVDMLKDFWPMSLQLAGACSNVSDIEASFSGTRFTRCISTGQSCVCPTGERRDNDRYSVARTG